ncbi:hypothetical protein J4G02_15215 [Candidatus Poribacteria bacterium]|nr:hypothetical protein [Candidatus Poribacteria bacterium]
MKHTNRQCRLDTLKIREAEGTLTEQERTELNAIFAELDAEEAEALKPARKRSQRLQTKAFEEKTELESTVAQLQDIINEQQQLLDDACSYLAQLRAKRTLLADKYWRLTGQELTFTVEGK